GAPRLRSAHAGADPGVVSALVVRANGELRKFFRRPRRARPRLDDGEGGEGGSFDHLFWPAERLILARVATRHELETTYSIDDLADGNDALDAQLEAERRARKAR